MQTNKEILFFYQYFGTSNGSWSTRVYELTKRWVDKGSNVTVVTAPYEKSDIKARSFISKQKIEGVKVIVINAGDSNRLPKYQRIIRALIFAFTSSFFALSRKYDVCIASSGPISIGIPMILAKKLRRKSTIFEVRDLWPAGAIEMGLINSKWQEKLALLFEKLCYDSADIIVTASIGQKEFISRKHSESRIDVIPNASDLALFGVKSENILPEWTKGKVLFTHIGSLGLIHNTRYWLNVAKELKKLDSEQRVQLVFIGEGKDKVELISEAEKSQLQNIKFLGVMPKKELPVWVQNSRATLFATLDNPVQDTCSPNKIFDSFAAGIPIVQTSSGWIKELVENENCGINVSLDTPQITAETILWFSQNKEEAHKMGRNALTLAEGIFNRDVLAYKYLKIISDVTVS